MTEQLRSGRKTQNRVIDFFGFLESALALQEHLELALDRWRRFPGSQR